MKKFLLLIAAGVLVTLAAFAGPVCAATVGSDQLGSDDRADVVTAFSNWTGRSATEVKYYDVYDVRGWRLVTVQWAGITSFSNYTGIQGTFKIYGGPTASGPWSPVNVAATALSYTADGTVTFANANNYLKVSFNRTRNGLRCYITRAAEHR